jgi:hypothetical protein
VDILATYEELKKSMKLSKNIHIIDVDVQFVLKKLFFFDGPPERRDDVEIHLLSWQAQNDLRCGRLWCPQAQVPPGPGRVPFPCAHLVCSNDPLAGQQDGGAAAAVPSGRL